jgi:GNAT superfamily N-acetyltransferase
MVQLLRTDSSHADFVTLVRHLDADLRIRDGEDHSFYAQFNKIDKIRHVVVAYLDGQAAGCGAIKEYAPKVVEVKRMYVAPACRGQGIATQVLAELERWARELSYGSCILETGVKQPEAVGLYGKSGYRVVPNYGQYAGVATSICFEKALP